MDKKSSLLDTVAKQTYEPQHKEMPFLWTLTLQGKGPQGHVWNNYFIIMPTELPAYREVV